MKTRVLAALAAPILLCACLVDDAGDLELETDSQAIAGDPSAAATYGWCLYKKTFNGTAGRIYYPPNGGCGLTYVSPLVVIMPGYGFHHIDYHDLGRHLARNGFIAVAVDLVANPATITDFEDTAAGAWDYVEDYVLGAWSLSNLVDTDHIGLVGHSRGGEAVRFLAEALEPNPDYTVRAVVDLASTNYNDQYLQAGDAVGALYLHGTLDGDVPPMRSGALYDNTGQPWSQRDPDYKAQVLHRTMKLLISGDHPSFTTTGPDPTQLAAGRGYTLAFLAAHLKYDFTWYEDYIRGDAVPGGYANPVYTQTADGFYARVIDNVESWFLAINSLFDTVEKSDSVTWSLDDLGADPDDLHDTQAIGATADDDGWIRWDLPAGKRDTTYFRTLSMRLGWRGPDLGDLGVTVQIRDGMVWSAPLEVSAYGDVPGATTVCDPTYLFACQAWPTPMPHMATLRIPLDDFGDHDDVRSVRLNLEGGAIGRELMIDSVHASDWIYSP